MNLLNFSSSGKPTIAKQEGKFDGHTHIKFNPDADVKQIGIYNNLRSKSRKSFKPKSKVKFKARKILNDDIQTYYRPRSHLPVASPPKSRPR